MSFLAVGQAWARPFQCSEPAPVHWIQLGGRRAATNRQGGIAAPLAALRPGGTHGWRMDRGLWPGPEWDGRAFARFGSRPALIGWAALPRGVLAKHLSRLCGPCDVVRHSANLCGSIRPSRKRTKARLTSEMPLFRVFSACTLSVTAPAEGWPAATPDSRGTYPYTIGAATRRVVPGWRWSTMRNPVPGHTK